MLEKSIKTNQTVEMSLLTAVRAVSRLLRESTLKDTAEKREWLGRMVSMVMTDQAIPGEVMAKPGERSPIQD